MSSSPPSPSGKSAPSIGSVPWLTSSPSLKVSPSESGLLGSVPRFASSASLKPSPSMSSSPPPSPPPPSPPPSIGKFCTQYGSTSPGWLLIKSSMSTSKALVVMAQRRMRNGSSSFRSTVSLSSSLLSLWMVTGNSLTSGSPFSHTNPYVALRNGSIPFSTRTGPVSSAKV